MKQVLVDQSACIGCQMCAQIAPASFQMSEEGVSVALNPPGDSEDILKQAIACCPVECISWLED
ncbi:MAG: ferredoxin [Candidatus Gracilibacteria bacterium]|nr:ferredoxin [Candidatus Gracilibacteria bacterium]